MAKLRTTFAPTALPAVRFSVGEPTSALSLEDLKAKAVAAGISSLEIVSAPPSDPYLIVKPENLVSLMQWLRNDIQLEFNFLQVISAVDFVDVPATDDQEGSKAHMELLYVLYSFPLKAYLNIKVMLDRPSPTIDTVSHLFRAANWYERECYDLLGITFRGHPHLERILLPTDWVGHPLQKDYVFPEEYNGMKVPL